MNAAPQSLRTDWRGIGLTINWVEEYLATDDGSYAVAHLEILADNRTPLPITETGYKSHFTSREAVGAVAYAIAWLDFEAAKPAWAAREAAARQLSLF